MHITYINICNCMWCMAYSMLIIHIFSRLSRCRPTPQHTSTKLVLACSCITMDNPVLHHKTRPSIAIDLARFCLAMQTLSRTPSTARPLLLRAGRRRAREGLHSQTKPDTSSWSHKARAAVATWDLILSLRPCEIRASVKLVRRRGARLIHIDCWYSTFAFDWEPACAIRRRGGLHCQTTWTINMPWPVMSKSPHEPR